MSEEDKAIDDKIEALFYAFLEAIAERRRDLNNKLIQVGINPSTVSVNWELPYYNILHKRLEDAGAFGPRETP